MKLTPAIEKFVLHWGEMGGRWGVNRSVAQIHALLYLSGEPMTAEAIAETLGLARSNVSNSLKELQGWELIQVAHVMGDRRDHFRAKTEIWEMLTVIMDGRKKREIDPTVAVLATCVDDAHKDRATPKAAEARMAEMLAFLTELSGWYEKIKSVPAPTLMKLMKMGARVAKLVGK
ncbi:MAG TPA: MarR family transcriptional regulator [Gammaproteobacteria bacterium]|nr:MarR family transcriptional regulator [Gammaproteobacteria bacterium]